MEGEIRKNDDLASDDDNKDKLFQELADELEYVFEEFPILKKNLITTIEATGYKIRKRFISIYAMRILGNGIYMVTEVGSFKIPKYLKDIDMYLEGLRKIMLSKARCVESVERWKAACQENGKNITTVQESMLPSIRVIRETNHTPRKSSRLLC